MSNYTYGVPNRKLEEIELMQRGKINLYEYGNGRKISGYTRSNGDDSPGHDWTGSMAKSLTSNHL